MKKLYFAILLMATVFMTPIVGANNFSTPLSESPNFEPVNITFFVNLANMAVAEEGVRMAGSFNGWEDTLMTSNDDGNWFITLALEPGTELEYKFKNGPDTWEDGITGECVTADGNRVLTIPTESQSIDVVSFNSCFLQDMPPPNSADTVDIVLIVNTDSIAVVEGGMLIAGSFNGWMDLAMTEDEAGNWKVTLALETGSEIQYKFKNGPDTWEDGITGDCVNGEGNRVFTVPDAAAITVVSFNSCEFLSAPPPTEVDTFQVTFTVDMSKTDSVSTEGMFIAGTFTNWDNAAMTDNADGTWSYSGRFGEGDFLNYKFKNGPTGWEANEVRECTVEGTLGDRGHTVGGADEVLPTVCFNSCFSCTNDVTFVVDASGIDSVAAEGMQIAGSFNGWMDGAMTQGDDGLWSTTITLCPGEVIQYKFKNGPDTWEDGITGSCTNSDGNRIVTVPGLPGALPTVCFNSCVGCDQVTLTLSVDMNQETIAEDGIFIAGSFNDWTDGPTTDNGDGTYSVSVVVDKNSDVTYKFKNGADGWEDSIMGDCVNGFGDRILAIAEEDVIAPEVCFNSCTTCTEPMVTFTVDMSEQTVDTAGVFLGGTFNEFGSMTMMDNMDGTWSVTIPLAPRMAYEYKFKNGPDTFEEIAGACTTGFSANREVKIGNDDVAIPTVCFNACVGCGLVGITLTVDMSQENVDEGGVRVAGSFSDWTDLLLTDVGNGLWSGTFGVMPNDTLEFKFKNGPDGWEGNLMGECAADNGNRTAIVADMDVTIMQSCFNSCDICMDEPDPDPIGLTTLNIENSCLNDDGTITIRFDLQYNCDAAPGNLSGMSEIGFHSGANNWSSVIDWNAETAATAVNDGNDVFSVTIDPVAYYGLESIDQLENIFMVFNQGPLVPDEPWGSEGKTDGEGGLGVCADIMLIFSELRNCSDIGGDDKLSSASLLAAGTCLGEDGTVTIAFDLADNCEQADGSLAGMNEIGFHSGANDWASVVAWDADGATTMANDGNDKFTITIDPAIYYGVVLADLTNIFFVTNQGPSFPDDPWASSGRDQGDGECIDFNVTISELSTCMTVSTTIDLVEENQFQVAPNPFSNQTLVSWNNPENENFQVSLLNVTGQLVRSYSNVNGTSIQIAKNDLLPGMYFLNFRDEAGNNGTLKLLIE